MKTSQDQTKLNAFEGLVWLKGELVCVSVKHEVFKLRIRACCSLTSPPHTLYDVTALWAWRNVLVPCHLVDQINVRITACCTSLKTAQLELVQGEIYKKKKKSHRRWIFTCSSKAGRHDGMKSHIGSKEGNKADEKWRRKNGYHKEGLMICFTK